MSHVKYLVPKSSFFGTIFFCHQYDLVFYLLLYKLILLYFEIDFAQDSKNFQKMDKNDVQKSIPRNTFGKFDALLGVLRNFFGATFERPYMQ